MTIIELVYSKLPIITAQLNIYAKCCKRKYSRLSEFINIIIKDFFLRLRTQLSCSLKRSCYLQLVHIFIFILFYMHYIIQQLQYLVISTPYLGLLHVFFQPVYDIC